MTGVIFVFIRSRNEYFCWAQVFAVELQFGIFRGEFLLFWLIIV